MSTGTSNLLWMAGAAWIAAVSAGIAAVVENSILRWFFVFGAVFNGIFAIYWAMMAASTTKPKERG